MMRARRLPEDEPGPRPGGRRSSKDPATAEALKPWYRQFCKRPSFHDEYLPTFNRPNVTLVDTDGQGVERITENGRGGRRRRVRGRLPHLRHRLRGRHRLHAARRLRDLRPRRPDADRHWADGLRTLHGFYSHGFPNCFYLGFTQNALTPNFPHMLDEQARHIADVVEGRIGAAGADGGAYARGRGRLAGDHPRHCNRRTSPSDRPAPRATTMVKAAPAKARACSTASTARARTPSSP